MAGKRKRMKMVVEISVPLKDGLTQAQWRKELKVIINEGLVWGEDGIKAISVKPVGTGPYYKAPSAAAKNAEWLAGGGSDRAHPARLPWLRHHLLGEPRDVELLRSRSLGLREGRHHQAQDRQGGDAEGQRRCPRARDAGTVNVTGFYEAWLAVKQEVALARKGEI